MAERRSEIGAESYGSPDCPKLWGVDDLGTLVFFHCRIDRILPLRIYVRGDGGEISDFHLSYEQLLQLRVALGEALKFEMGGAKP